MDYRYLNQYEIEQLEDQGCHSDNWQLVMVAEDFEAAGIHNVGFEG